MSKGPDPQAPRPTPNSRRYHSERGELINTAGTNLQLWFSERLGGYRHYLDGQPVHCGTGLELLMADGTWKRVRYETQRYSDTPEPRPVLHFDVELAGIPKSTERKCYYHPDAWIAIPAWATLRWPVREGRR